MNKQKIFKCDRCEYNFETIEFCLGCDKQLCHDCLFLFGSILKNNNQIRQLYHCHDCQFIKRQPGSLTKSCH